MSEYNLTTPQFHTAQYKTTAADGLQHQNLKEKAQEFEAIFVAQMLKYSGLTEALTQNGGKDMAAFSDFYVQSVAGEIVQQDGFGLAEKFYETLLKKQNQSPQTIDIKNVS